MDTPILTGVWDEHQSWELFESATQPDSSVCTAVYCIAILPQTNQVVLTRNHRGWEMLGGHIEPGETIEQALVRECLEEGGFMPERYRLFGYRKITSKQPIPHSQREGFYPFPHGYIPHFIAVSAAPLQPPSGPETEESKTFTFDELRSLTIEQAPLIKAMLASYEKYGV